MPSVSTGSSFISRVYSLLSDTISLNSTSLVYVYHIFIIKSFLDGFATSTTARPFLNLDPGASLQQHRI